ncbi:hypothetical protein M0R04_07495 [Candidatus Dojkabacteria bacterium]|jgi:hypothetical protein|nr:hypothetical protein [Candidatus Dojkabacteria bacterium]
MPTAYITKIAKKHHTSVEAAEGKWETAKTAAVKEGKGENFAYITGIFKKLMKESVRELSLKQFLSLSEMNEVGDVSYGSHEDEIDYDEENQDDLDNPEEGDGEFDDADLTDEDDLKNHKGHKLADVLDDDEVKEHDQDEDQDEFGDNFDEADVDEKSQGQGDFRSSKYSGREDEDGIGEATQCNFLQDLMIINEKKKPLKKVAKSVYHRDYEVTKKKPYRKYKPEDHVSEGAFDYLKGVGQHVGSKIANSMADKGRQILQPIRQAHAAGQQASQQSDIRSLTNSKTQLMQRLVQYAGKMGPDNVVKAINQVFAQKQINLAKRLKKDFLAAAQQQAPTNEGFYDYVKGAGSAVKGAVQNIHAQGRQASQQADLIKTIQQLGQVVLKLYKVQNQPQQQVQQRPGRYD